MKTLLSVLIIALVASQAVMWHSLSTIRDAIQRTNAITSAACGSDERPCQVVAHRGLLHPVRHIHGAIGKFKARVSPRASGTLLRQPRGVVSFRLRTSCGRGVFTIGHRTNSAKRSLRPPYSDTQLQPRAGAGTSGSPYTRASWPGLSRPSTSYFFCSRKEDVDARHKAGHDGLC